MADNLSGGSALKFGPGCQSISSVTWEENICNDRKYFVKTFKYFNNIKEHAKDLVQ